jgi:hypothetical protein
MIAEREAFLMFLALQQKRHFTVYQLLRMKEGVQNILRMLLLAELIILQVMIQMTVTKILDQ